MRLYEKEILIPLIENHKGLLEYFQRIISEQVSNNEVPIRFVVTKTDDKGYHCELGILSGAENFNTSVKSIFGFKKRPLERNEKFTAVLVIPTGIDAFLGGHAGDAGALSRLIASTCDTLITHPNVVNASDINELPENGLYIEGSILSRLIMGTVGLQKVKANKLLVVVEEHEDKFFTESTINAVSAGRACLGIDAEVIRLKNKFRMKSQYAKSGRAVGIVENLEGIYNMLQSKKGDYDAIALSSKTEIDSDVKTAYYLGNEVNPWGGVEAILTHALSSLSDIPSAHSPMMDSREVLNINYGIIDPRKAAEIVSVTFFHCLLKGLYKSPKIISDPNYINQPGIISAADINCLVIPDRCIGLPTLAALEQGIPVIAVRENKNLMRNNLEQLPWARGQLIAVENYWEAAGVISALKSGVSLESVRRPLKFTKIIEE